jgi:hypothetical protein
LKRDGAEINVLLYQGYDNKDRHKKNPGKAEKTEVEKVAEFCIAKHKQDPTFPRLDLILCLSDDSEPPTFPEKVGDTMIVSVGHKGRFVGVVGVFRTKNTKGPPFQLRYQLVSIGPEFETPPGKEKDHELMDLLEKYTQEVKNRNYLAEYKQAEHPVQMYVKGSKYTEEGSETCMGCHAGAYKVWKHSKHAEAYKTLVEVKHPSLRQFDGECIVCHTVGFDYKTGFRDLEKTKFLAEVGCESCHGPCSEHVRKPNNKEIYQYINKYKYRGKDAEDEADKNTRMLQIESSCVKCHDPDNDVNWKFDTRWKDVVHMRK